MTLTQHQTINEARDLVLGNAAKLGEITRLEFILCEDSRTVMIYCDVGENEDAIAIYFDLAPGEPFDPARHAADFESPPRLN